MKIFTAAFVPAIIAVVLLSTPPVQAATTTISGTTQTSKVTLASGDELDVSATGTLNVSSNNDAVLATGNATVNNQGTILQSATGSNANRAIRDNTGSTSVSITNGSISNSTALIQAADSDAIQMNKASNTVVLYNYGQIISLNASAGGAQALDFAAITSGSNTVYNYYSGLIQATNADAVRPGVNGIIYNSGTIKSIIPVPSSGGGTDGIDGQNNTGIVIYNAYSGTNGGGAANLIEGARHGITGGQLNDTTSFTMTISNNAGGIIRGDNGSGINIDGFNALEQVYVTNSGTITGNGSTLTGTSTDQDGDGIDVDGVAHITNYGTIRSLNAINDTSEGITIGGGSIVNYAGGIIEGSVATPGGTNSAVGRGITLAGLDKDANGNAIPIQKIYADSTITNFGLIKGDSDSGIAILGLSGTTNYSVTITNSLGGIIEGGGATAPAIDASTVANPVTIVNWGTIEADASGKAIAFGSGVNSLQINGGCASIIGNIDGGTGTTSVTIDPTKYGTFSYSGVISNVASVDIQSGHVIFSGDNTYTGETNVNGGRLEVDGSVGGDVNVSRSAEVGGHGKIAGTIGGSGAVGPGNSPGILTATATDPTSGLSYNFEFTRSGEPVWCNASASGNDVLHLVGETPFTEALSSGNDINIYFAGVGAIYEGGFFVDGISDGLTANIADASFTYYLLDDENGTITYNGHLYDILSADDVTATTIMINDANFGDGTVSGWTEQFTVAVPEPSPGYALLGVTGILGLLAFRRRGLI